MRHNTSTIGGHHGTHDVEAALFWVFAGIILLIAFGDAVAVLAVTVAILAGVSWIYGKVQRSFERNDAHTAPVTHLYPESAGQYDAKRTSAQELSHRPHAA